MKTASEWLVDEFCLVKSNGSSGLIDAEGIRMIQLDAINHGMEFSATIESIMPLMPHQYANESATSYAKRCIAAYQKAILTTAQELKEIPR